MNSIGEINHEADHEPDQESKPGIHRKSRHDENTGSCSQRSDDPGQGSLERPFGIGMTNPENRDPDADEYKRQERSDRHQLADETHRHAAAANGDEGSSRQRRDMRGAILLM